MILSCRSVAHSGQGDSDLILIHVDIVGLQHFTFVGDHLLYVQWVVAANIRTKIVDSTDKTVLFWELSQPWTPSGLLASYGTYPQVMNWCWGIFKYVWAMLLPFDHITSTG